MQNISDDSEIADFVNDSGILYKISLSLVKKLLHFDSKKNQILEDWTECVSEVESITNAYQQMTKSNLEIRSRMVAYHRHSIQNYQYEVWMRRIHYQYDSLLHCIRKLVCKLMKLYSPESLQTAVKLIKYFNKLASLDLSINLDVRFVSSFSSVFENKKPFTINRVLKMLARDRTECCASELIDCLIKKYNEMDKINSPLSCNTDAEEEIAALNTEDEMPPESDNTSIFVYKTLTQYASPPENAEMPIQSKNNKIVAENHLQEEAMAHLILAERKRLSFFFSAFAAESAELLPEDKITFSQKHGKFKICAVLKQRLVETYERALWQNIGIIGEHILLWWSDSALGKKHHLVSQKFSSWLKQYHVKGNVHVVIQPTIRSLIDCLCCYITSTSWDELFSQALISADYQHSRHELHDIGLGTKTGHLFSDTLYDIVFLTNSCEGSNWTIQDLENLPLVEQIPLLHRLDHSIHTVRLWSIGRAKHLTNCWNMEQFFRVTHVDINASIYALNQLKLSQNVRLVEEKENAHFHVCSKMRTKLISEVNANIEKLQNVPNQSLMILASVCKIISLAYLKICFPRSAYWQQQLTTQPTIPTDYVEKYLDEILKPVLLASQNLPLPVQKSVSKLVLEILCEAWLDHIYKFRIKFSEWGAVQLLVDFASISVWISDKVDISDDIRQFLQTDEILRRCEGVGRLLLRQPGDSIIMTNESNTAATTTETESKDLETSRETLMPPEILIRLFGSSLMTKILVESYQCKRIRTRKLGFRELGLQKKMSYGYDTTHQALTQSEVLRATLTYSGDEYDKRANERCLERNIDILRILFKLEIF